MNSTCVDCGVLLYIIPNFRASPVFFDSVSKSQLFHFYNLILGTKLQYAQWIPKKNKIAYVFENNIYVRDFALDEDTQVTNDGIIGKSNI